MNLEKPTKDNSLGFSVLGMFAHGVVFACIKGVTNGGIAEVDGNIKAGDRIMQVRVLKK